DEARREVAALASHRPGWSRVAVAEARIDDLANNTDQAITAYQRAVDLGERDPALIQRLAQLLAAKQRYVEADQIIRKLPEQALRSSDLQRMAAEASLRSKEVARAAELARKSVKADSSNYREHIRLGQVLWASNQEPNEVEAEFRKAVALAEKEPDAWVVLIQHLLNTNQKEKAAAEMQNAKAKIPADRVHLALAQCHQMMGQIDEARVEYEAALKAKPEDPAILRGAALYYLQA